MANKTDGITDLTKVLIAASKKFSKTEYSKLTNVIFAMLHGVNYGYDQMDQRFLSDATDIHLLHHDEAFMKKMEKKLKKKIKKNKNNVINFSDYYQDDKNDGG